jgi:hypothetical protein
MDTISNLAIQCWKCWKRTRKPHLATRFNCGSQMKSRDFCCISSYLHERTLKRKKCFAITRRQTQFCKRGLQKNYTHTHIDSHTHTHTHIHTQRDTHKEAHTETHKIWDDRVRVKIGLVSMLLTPPLRSDGRMVCFQFMLHWALCTLESGLVFNVFADWSTQKKICCECRVGLTFFFVWNPILANSYINLLNK